MRKLEFETDAFAFADKVCVQSELRVEGTVRSCERHIKQLAVRSLREGLQGSPGSGALLLYLGGGGCSQERTVLPRSGSSVGSSQGM